MKDQKHYNKLVSSGNTKKINKILQEGEKQEKEMVFNAFGAGAKVSDPIYNQLVGVFQSCTQKENRLMAIEAMGESGRSAAVTQLELLDNQETDPQVKEAIRDAIRNLRNS